MGYYGRRWGGYYGYGGYPYAYGYWKRDAEEQPDQMVKREAEEGDAKPAMLYAGYYGHYPTTLHYGVAGYPYAHHPYALAHPAVTYAAPVAPTVAVKPYTYYANSGGAVHIVKRDAEAKPEAEAEASPESWYYGYYGHPYRWGGYYRGYYGYGYPYRYWWKRSAEQLQPESQHIVKRSADADADADASPESWYYGYYGHPYMGRLLQRILRIRLSRLLLGLGLFHPRILSSDPTALTTIHTFLSAAIFKFKKSKFDDRNYCVNIHQNWDLSAKFFI